MAHTDSRYLDGAKNHQEHQEKVSLLVFLAP
jgi:hypothetical protein